MGTVSWRKLSLALFIALCLTSLAIAQTTPDDSTTITSEENDVREELIEGVERDNPTERLQWQIGAWGAASAEFRRHSLREADKHNKKKKQRGPTWVNIGPTGANFEQNGPFTGLVRDSGRARTILPHPTDANIVYFLNSGGGLWKTTNWESGNTTWRVLTDDLPTTGGGSVAFGRTPNVLYLGLGDFVDQILVGGAMVKSIDGGETWSPIIELGNAVSVRDVKVDTSASQDIILVATDNGFFRSTDAGATYTPISTFANLSVWSIERTSAGWLAVAQACATAAPSIGLRCGFAATIFVSTDKGATWSVIPNAGNVFSANGRTTLAVGLPGDSVVYAYSATQNDGAMRDVYRSSDGGLNWTANNVNSTKIPTNPVPASLGVGANPNMNICHGQCWYNQLILVDPRDPTRNTVWIGGDLASARTTNGGATWTLTSFWLYSAVPPIPYVHADMHTAAFKSTGTPTIILGNDGGMNITTDNGASFSSDKNNGLISHLFYTIIGHPKLPNLVMGGTQDNGTRLRLDNGSIFNQVIGGDGTGASYSQANTNTLMGSAQSSSLRTNLSGVPSKNNQHWIFLGTTGLSDIGAPFLTALLPAPANLDPTGRVVFHFTATRVWRSNNGGLNWNLIGAAPLGIPGQPVSPGLPLGRQFRSSPYNISVSPTDLNRIAVGAGGGFLDITTDGGATWTDINLGAGVPGVGVVPGWQGFITNVLWADNQTLWLTSVALPAGATRVVKATIANPSDSWSTATYTILQNGLPDVPVSRVYLDPRDTTKNTLYAATHVGIYRTIDGGANWAPYGNNIPAVRVNDIYMPPDGSFMRIATYGRGIWELPQIEFVKAELTDDAKSCDRDGVLDNGEIGHLTVTLHNQGSGKVNNISATVTSSNPNVTFPLGKVISFPSADGNGTTTATIRVKLNGAADVDATDFNIAVSSAQLGLPSSINYTSSHRVNFDDQRAVSAIETAESKLVEWTSVGTNPAASPNFEVWQRRALSGTRHVWWGPDNNGLKSRDDGTNVTDQQSLVSPTLQVGPGPLIISFEHRFAFDPLTATVGADAGLIEISKDDGATWTDVGTPLYNGVTGFNVNAGIPGDNPIGIGRAAFVSRSANYPEFVPAILNLGTTYANQTVRLRFRIAANSSGGNPGWEIDNINVSGLTSTPFSALVAEGGACTAPGQE